jgi:UDP-N-acetylglucosamine 2-epimerase (non-hydrolysing)/GDP/UDP-N,N'-diacetylbacillosamine 2-epimerase (hydrolysing)
MKHADVMVGNSSSGIIEAPSFRLAVVNVGSRQEGRLRGQNVVEVSYQKGEILMGIRKTLFESAFLSNLQASINPYGDGRATERIIQHLSEIQIDSHLLQKKIQY